MVSKESDINTIIL